ncbi:MAG: hypothetical protein LBG59_07870 [Candidatus Peribacteria bacterium]|jgi:hypothetical protein|nr:hypothetical protein [Candidatus Peribacteria bacterium]
MKKVIGKYEYVGEQPTRIKTTPYTEPVDLEFGDLVLSVSELPSRYFKPADLSPDEALSFLVDMKLLYIYASLSDDDLVDILEENEVEIPEEYTRGTLVVLMIENQIVPE